MKSHAKQKKKRVAPVEEDAANIIMANGRFLGTGSHAERPKEAIHQDGKLVHVFCLCFHHVEHNMVPLPHALSVRGADIVLDNDFPLPPTQPATHETLHLYSHSTLSFSHNLVSLHFNMQLQFFTILIFLISGSSSSWLFWYGCILSLALFNTVICNNITTASI